MGKFCDSPDIDKIVCELEDEYTTAYDRWMKERTSEAWTAMDQAAKSFENARNSAYGAGPTRVSGDATLLNGE